MNSERIKELIRLLSLDSNNVGIPATPMQVALFKNEAITSIENLKGYTAELSSAVVDLADLATAELQFGYDHTRREHMHLIAKTSIEYINHLTTTDSV